MKLSYIKRSPHAKDPKRGSRFAAGFDLAASEGQIIPAGKWKVISTGLEIAVPEGTYGRGAPRSGLAAKHGIDVGAGVIDYDYRGIVGVILINHGVVDFEVKIGDRIAQLILEKVDMADAEEVKELPSTERGENGFGSTGVTADGMVQTTLDKYIGHKRLLIPDA